MAIVYEKSQGLTEAPFHFCPDARMGCSNSCRMSGGNGSLGEAIGVASRMCVFSYNYFTCDMHQAALPVHRRSRQE